MGNIVIGVLFIIGGLSGQFGIRGIPNSQYGLVAIGVGLLLWGGYQMKNSNNE